MDINSVQDVAEVFEFDELNERQQQISGGSWFIRSEVLNLAGRGWKKVKPLNEPTCVCDEPYEPFDPKQDKRVMHYCPACTLWFHEECLEARGPRTPSDSVIFQRSFISSAPPIISPSPSFSPTPSPSSSFPERASGRSSDNAPPPRVPTPAFEAAEPYPASRLSRLPSSLLALASSSISRSSDDAGIVGTAERTLAARHLVWEVCTSKKPVALALEWQRRLGIFEEKPVDPMELEEKFWGAGPDGGTVYKCPECKLLI